MKTMLAWLAFAAALAVGTAEASPKPPSAAATNSIAALATNLPPGQVLLRFSITGMTCEGCAGGLRGELQAAPGVKTAVVSLKDKQASVICETNRISTAQLLKVIKEAGFEGKLVAP